MKRNIAIVVARQHNPDNVFPVFVSEIPVEFHLFDQYSMGGAYVFPLFIQMEFPDDSKPWQRSLL